MAVQNFTPSPTEIDLEATAELPALDFAGTATDIASTDVHLTPGIPAGVAELASSLREAEQRLARKMERVSGLEADLANALRAAVELRAQVDQESVQATRRENALREAEQQLAQKTARLADLETELATAQRNATGLRERLDKESARSGMLEKSWRESEQKLSARIERVTALEKDLANEQRVVAEQRALLDQERLQGAQRERVLRERGLALEQQLSDLRQELVVRDAGQRQQNEDLLDLRRRNERSLEALQTWQGFRGVAAAQLDEREAQLAQANAQLAAQIAAADARGVQLQSETRTHAARLQADAEARIAKVQSEAQARVAKLQAETEALTAQLQAELAAARMAAESRVAALDESLRVAVAANEAGTAALQMQQQLNQTLQAQLDVAAATAVRVEQDLHVAEEHIQRLESDAHASATLLGNLQQNVERLGRDDTGSRPVLRVVATEPAQRVLIRTEDGVDVVYPLGRRTTIGRTPDNDIQVDTTFISRHHAVLLSNPDQCVVEDLNSTNGVKINGRPVNRQALRDGDTLTVGKSEFRYQQRA
jgi:chromosome segregation ATPase